ncbi:Sucraseferredoxin-like protein [Protomyces lactucae-debilis]|uniref:Sucraseferredoxin-like protein n=1 Tax=Protomyces lactucae-debilis TaxID=2754530 RepID=A0A1Y2ETH5_PROLT|nr:Sucraseferredoxin-like protein [Protomyces lactucae-debilis]ORY74859.1 Sucraseferredoxin-like protein [Protomyces lactucae-debilis]
MRGSVKPLSVHICIATERHDWPHTIEDEEGSLAQAIGKAGLAMLSELQKIDRVVLSNVSLPLPNRTNAYTGYEVYILYNAWCKLENVQKEDAEHVLLQYALSKPVKPASYTATPMGFRAVVLVCSHMRRDARCGKTAPILLEALEEGLRERDMFYDKDEGSEDGKVLVTTVSHIGGHRYAGNVLVYRKTDTGTVETLWLGRIMPNDIPWVIEYTVLQGRVKRSAVRGGVQW